MSGNITIEDFLSNYEHPVNNLALLLRAYMQQQIPGIQEELDLSAKIIGYGFGQRYIDTICSAIFSKKGIKLGFNKGASLADPDGILEGSGKVHKYVNITPAMLQSASLRNLLNEGYNAYKLRIAEQQKP